MPRNALGHALGQNNIENFELLRGFITIQGIVPPPFHEFFIFIFRIRKTLNTVITIISFFLIFFSYSEDEVLLFYLLQ